MAAEGFSHFEGMANERAAFFQVKLGNRADAENYFVARAMELFKYEWGSITKYDWLKEESAKALAKIDEHETGVVDEAKPNRHTDILKHYRCRQIVIWQGCCAYPLNPKAKCALFQTASNENLKQATS
jgi:hypothetical protein